jgi:hypothetical protein
MEASPHHQLYLPAVVGTPTWCAVHSAAGAPGLSVSGCVPAPRPRGSSNGSSNNCGKGRHLFCVMACVHEVPASVTDLRVGRMTCSGWERGRQTHAMQSKGLPWPTLIAALLLTTTPAATDEPLPHINQAEALRAKAGPFSVVLRPEYRLEWEISDGVMNATMSTNTSSWLGFGEQMRPPSLCPPPLSLSLSLC